MSSIFLISIFDVAVEYWLEKNVSNFLHYYLIKVVLFNKKKLSKTVKINKISQV